MSIIRPQKPIRRACFFVSVALLGISCSSSDSPMATEESPDASSPTSTAPAAEKDEESSPSPDIEPQDSSYIFDQNQLHTFELRLPQTSLDFLNADPMAEEYVEGELVFEGETVGPVGIRYKGAVGAWVGCVGKGEIFASGGSKACTKLSMKVKINWDDPDAEFSVCENFSFTHRTLMKHICTNVLDIGFSEKWEFLPPVGSRPPSRQRRVCRPIRPNGANRWKVHPTQF